MITVRDSSEKVAGGFTLMTGANTASVVAINPTVEQLKVIYDRDDVKEPSSYVGKDNNGNPNVRIDLHIKPTGIDTVQKFSIFLSDAETVTKDGLKKQYTNAHGQYSYFPVPPSGQPVAVPENQAKFFNIEGLRTAFQGEEKLVTFIQAWANLKTGKDGDNATFDFTKLFAGDFTQLNEVLTACNQGEPNTVGLMFGVRLVPQDDGSTKRYQDVYTKAFFRPYDDLNAKFTEELNDPYGAWDRDYQGSTEWKVYSPTTVNVTEGATATSSLDTITGEDELPW
jgi:hypothetical protein